MENFYSFITDRIDIEKEELDTIASSFERRVFPKDKFVIKKGQVATNYYFVESGGL